MKRIHLLIFLVFAFIFSCNNDDDSEDQNDDGPDSEVTLGLTNAFPGLSFAQPLDLQSPNDGTNRIFVVEKGGRIEVFLNTESVDESTTFLDVSGNLSTSSEQGLLGLAFHPNFSSNGYFYVHYNPNASVSYISRFTAMNGTNTADLNSELVVLEIPQPATNHNGGQLAFGPDGYLYISVGDGGGSGDPDGNAQNPSNLLGNILRIDVDNTEGGLNYAIPSDNPFTSFSNFRPEIYAWGLRNPWRMSFDMQTGNLWTGDVGQNEIEEINVVQAGGNYGWNIFEGTSCFSGPCDTVDLIEPIFEYDQSNADRSITGGYVYRGTNITSLEGKYVYGDFVSGRIWALSLDGNENELVDASGLNIASFGTDANEELYICAFDGVIYKIVEESN